MGILEVAVMLTYGVILAAYARKVDKSDACARASMCFLNRADLVVTSTNNTADPKFIAFRQKAVELIRKDASSSRDVIKGCERELIECEVEFKTQAYYAGYPHSLVDPCYTRSIPYTLFLCKTIENWPKEITSVAPAWFTRCQDACPTIPEFNRLHKARGKSANDFPRSWTSRLKMQIKRNSAQKALDDENSFEPELESRARRDWMPHDYYSDYIFERYRDINRGNKEPIMCPENSYVGSIESNLPYGFLAECYKIGKSKIKQRTIGGPLFASSKTSNTPTSTRSCQVKDHFLPPYGSFVIGMRVKTREVLNPNGGIGSTTVIDDILPLCSGHDWDIRWIRDSGPKQDEDTDFICAPLTAVCVIEPFRLELSENFFIVNLRIGCCAMDPEHWYSSIPQQKYITYQNVKGEWTQVLVGHTLILDYGPFYNQWTPPFYCPPGSFVNRFVWNMQVPPVSVRPKKPTRTKLLRLFLMMRQIFFCNDFGLTHGPNGVPLGSNFMPAVLLDFHLSTQVTPILDQTCKGGFFSGGFMSVADVPDNANDKYYEYSMRCFDEWLGKTINTADFNIFANGPDQGNINLGGNRLGDGRFACRTGYAICGMRIKQGADKGFDVTVHGPYLDFICCPIPPFWPPYDCKSTGGKIIYELQRPETDCQFQFGRAETCTVTEGRIYETSTIAGEKEWKRKKREDEGPDTTAPKFIKKYGFTLSDKLIAMVKYPRRVLGDVMKDVLDSVPNAAIITGTRRRRKRQKSPSLMIGEAIIAGVAPMINAIIGKIPVGGSGGGGGGGDGGVGLTRPMVTFEKSTKQTQSITTRTQKTVDETQSAFFYDVVLKCGAHRLYSDQKLRFITLSRKNCVVQDKFEFIQKYTENSGGSTQTFSTFPGKNYGVGLYISSDGRTPLERAIKWEKLTKHVKLAFAGKWSYTRLDETLLQPWIWNEYNLYDQLKWTMTIPQGSTVCLYRYIASCGPYELYTTTTTHLLLNNANEPCPDEGYGIYPKLFHAPKLVQLPV